MRLGIFGGTFDPIHYGHLRIAETAREALALERVMFIPVGAPVHRARPPRAGREHRYAMCIAATDTHPDFMVSRIETETPEPAYTVDTLRRIHAERPGDNLHLIIGADEAVAFPTWHLPREILELARLAVATRPGLDGATLLERLPDWLCERMDVLPPLSIGISSTDIRARFQEERSVRYLMPDEVRTHIEKYGLYKSSTHA
jgi:nicotinate-nucleotide adenylyltransferase